MLGMVDGVGGVMSEQVILPGAGIARTGEYRLHQAFWSTKTPAPVFEIGAW